MKIIEMVYILLSVFMFLWCWFLNDAMELAAFSAIAGMIVGIGGIFLTYRARDRVLIFWSLLVATLMTSSLLLWYVFGRYFIYVKNGIGSWLEIYK
jgi:hypothetical protein